MKKTEFSYVCAATQTIWELIWIPYYEIEYAYLRARKKQNM